jgi:hypothetical protein
MAKINKIGVVSSAKLLGAMMLIIGLIAGILYSGIGVIVDALGRGLNGGTALAFLALIGMPLIFATSGVLVGAIGAFLYNLVAGWVGGIEMDVEQKV